MDTITFEKAPGKLIGYTVAAFAMTGIGIALLIGASVARKGNLFVAAIGGLGAVCFAFCAIVILWHLFSGDKIVLTLSSQGIRDTRVAAEIIPWWAVSAISVWEFKRQKLIVLKVDPLFERNLSLTTLVRLTRGTNAWFGADGLCISASGLKTSFNNLYHLIRTYSGK